jgi:hypothetical protein
MTNKVRIKNKDKLKYIITLNNHIYYHKITDRKLRIYRFNFSGKFYEYLTYNEFISVMMQNGVFTEYENKHLQNENPKLLKYLQRMEYIDDIN